MSKTHSQRAPQGAAGACRDHRRPQGERRPEWARLLRRANRTIDASLRLVDTIRRTICIIDEGAVDRPVRTTQELYELSARLVTVAVWLERTARELAAVNACLARNPESAAERQALLAETTERWVDAHGWLGETAADLFKLHRDVLQGLEDRELVPEPPPGRRPRILYVVARPVPVRAFLAARRPRVTDRINPLLRRRRRTPRPAESRVPKRGLRGRAPPFSSTCLL